MLPVAVQLGCSSFEVGETESANTREKLIEHLASLLNKKASFKKFDGHNTAEATLATLSTKWFVDPQGNLHCLTFSLVFLY